MIYKLVYINQVTRSLPKYVLSWNIVQILSYNFMCFLQTIFIMPGEPRDHSRFISYGSVIDGEALLGTEIVSVQSLLLV